MIRPFAAEFYNKPLDQLSASQMRDYVARLRERPDRYVRAAQRPQIAGGLSHESLRDHLRALRRFFNWSWSEYQLEANKNPMLKLRMPGRERKEPKAISLEDLAHLLNACDDSTAGIRDRAMITLLADTGCRVGGPLSLKKDNSYSNHSVELAFVHIYATSNYDVDNRSH
jgi:site-specific recombinase XerC